jgi:hypothetical protein
MRLGSCGWVTERRADTRACPEQCNRNHKERPQKDCRLRVSRGIQRPGQRYQLAGGRIGGRDCYIKTDSSDPFLFKLRVDHLPKGIPLYHRGFDRVDSFACVNGGPRNVSRALLPAHDSGGTVHAAGMSGADSSMQQETEKRAEHRHFPRACEPGAGLH